MGWFLNDQLNGYAKEIRLDEGRERPMEGLFVNGEKNAEMLNYEHDAFIAQRVQWSLYKINEFDNQEDLKKIRDEFEKSIKTSKENNIQYRL